MTEVFVLWYRDGFLEDYSLESVWSTREGAEAELARVRALELKRPEWDRREDECYEVVPFNLDGSVDRVAWHEEADDGV